MIQLVMGGLARNKNDGITFLKKSEKNYIISSSVCHLTPSSLQIFFKKIKTRKITQSISNKNKTVKLAERTNPDGNKEKAEKRAPIMLTKHEILGRY